MFSQKRVLSYDMIIESVIQKLSVLHLHHHSCDIQFE